MEGAFHFLLDWFFPMFDGLRFRNMSAEFHCIIILMVLTRSINPAFWLFTTTSMCYIWCCPQRGYKRSRWNILCQWYVHLLFISVSSDLSTLVRYKHRNITFRGIWMICTWGIFVESTAGFVWKSCLCPQLKPLDGKVPKLFSKLWIGWCRNYFHSAKLLTHLCPVHVWASKKEDSTHLELLWSEASLKGGWGWGEAVPGRASWGHSSFV